MATTTAKKTAAKKTTKKTAASAPAAKKTTKKTAAKATAKKTAAKKTTKKAAPKTPRLRERDLKIVLEDAGYATAGIVGDVVERARTLPDTIERLRSDAGKVTEEAPSRLRSLREVPELAEQGLSDLRTRLAKDVERYLNTFEKRFDAKAKDGRKLADEVRSDDRVERVLSQADNARSQLRGALTSITKTADVAVDAASSQVGNVTTQAKATVTTARKAAEDTTAKAKGTVTAARKGAEATGEATAEQARTASQQSKAAATSVKKTAEAATE